MSQAASKPAEPVSQAEAPGLGKKILLLLFSLLFCLLIFVGLDGLYSALFRKSSVPTPSELLGCLVVDPVRAMSLQPNCSTTRAWGRERYQLNINSQGFRDETVREVPPTDPRPRLLMLGDSFTESMGPWNTSYVGRIAKQFPQYEILNGGVGGYSPSNYLNTERIAMKSGLQFDEAIVFIDISDVQDEAGLVHDIDLSGSVALAKHQYHYSSSYSKLRLFVSKYLVLTNYLWERVERILVGRRGALLSGSRLQRQRIRSGALGLDLPQGRRGQAVRGRLRAARRRGRHRQREAQDGRALPGPEEAEYSSQRRGLSLAGAAYLRQSRFARGTDLARLVRGQVQTLRRRLPGILCHARSVSQVSAGLLVSE